MSVASAQDQLVGRMVGEFVLRERIGEGGFGLVYRATQPALDRAAVVKLLHNRLQQSPAVTERFLREAKLASKLDHPYAAHIYAFGAEPDGEMWIAMELVRGTPLDQLLKVQGPLPLERFVPLLDRICEVVHSAHEQGIVHRDLKPANVMVLARAGRLLPKLLDFGIAKAIAESGVSLADTQTPAELVLPDIGFSTAETLPSGGSQLTQRGSVMGSPSYMAPEQWVDPGAVDARTDLYALGVLAYEALTGKVPFSARTLTDIARAHAKQHVPDLGPGFPPALDKVLAKVLAKKAADRYDDALAFATAFRQAAGLTSEAIQLPAIDAATRTTALQDAPQPIAEAVAALEAARNPHQARASLVQLVRTIVRYVALLALSCRSRVSDTGEPPAISESLRTLYRRTLSDHEWLALARDVTRRWVDRRDAYPLPELVEMLHDGPAAEHLEALVLLRDVEVASDAAVERIVADAVVQISSVLDEIRPLYEYPLVVTIAPGLAESWMGARRTQRTTRTVRDKNLPAGVPMLLDRDGVPVLTLAPLFAVAVPAPGAPLDMFLFDGRDRRGAKFVALPFGFEHHDDELWDWFRAQLHGSLVEAKPDAGDEVPPYRGLSPFSSEDGAMFFGREALVDAFANRLRLQPLLAVVGPSGAGKSSFVQAGVIPALAGWQAVVVRPGPAPLGTLLARLQHSGFATDGLRGELAKDRDALGNLLRSDAGTRGPVVLVIDQLEELFTLCLDGDERATFVEAITAAARDASDPVRVIFTLRDDFLLRIEQLAPLRNRIGQALQLLSVPVAEDLLRILVEPARRAGYELEDPELAHEMISEVAEQPGALALLSFAAAKLWELRDRHFHQLTRKAYKSLGGVGGALAQHAELTLERMPPEERQLTRDAFRHLVTTQNTRAVLERKELRQLLGGSEHADGVMEKLVAARLLVASENETGAETIEIVHEALLVTWPRLVEWRHHDAEGMRMREQLRTAAKQWHDRGRPKGLLWRGDALADLVRWRARSSGPLTDLEAAFADASLAESLLARRVRRLVLGAIVAGLIVGLIVLQRANRVAERNADEAKAEALASLVEQGRVALVAHRPQEAAVYLSAAYSRGAEDPNLPFMLGEVRRGLPDPTLLLRTESGVILWADFTPDGARVITSADNGVVGIWNRATGVLERALHASAGVTIWFSMTRDGGLLTYDPKERPVMWDVATGTPRFTLVDAIGARAMPTPDQTTIVSIDGKTVALWNAHDGSRIGSRPLVTTQPPRLVVRDGTYATLTPAGIVVGGFDLAEPIVLADSATVRFALDPSGHYVAAALDSHSDVKLWNVAKPSEPRILAGHTGDVLSLAFSPDGRWLATTSFDHTARIWDVATGQSVATMTGHEALVLGLAWNTDSSQIATASFDQTARVWDARTGAQRAAFYGFADRVYGVTFDPTGAALAAASFDGAARVFDVRPATRTIQIHHDGPITLRASGDERRLLAVGHDGSAWLIDVDGGATIAAFEEFHAPAAISQRNAVLDLHVCGDLDATGARVVFPAQRTARLVRVDDRAHPVVLGPLDSDVTCARFARDGRIVLATASGQVSVWSADGKRLTARKLHDGRINDVAIDRVTGRVATASQDKRVMVFDLDSDRPPIAFEAATAAVHGVAFSHDGRWLAAGSEDTIARVYRLEDRALVYATHELADVYSVDFSADDLRIAVATTDGTVSVRGRADGRLLARYGDSSLGWTTSVASLSRVPVLASGDDRGAVRLWPIATDDRPAGALAAAVACKVPLRLDEAGHLVESHPACTAGAK